MKKKVFIFTCACVVWGMCLNNVLAHKKPMFSIASYSVGSTQYLWTASHANLINKYSTKMQATAAFCGAETAVVKLLGQNKIEFGEVANIELEFAKRGEWGYSKQPEAGKEYVKNIRAVFFEPYGSMQMITLADSGIKSYKDLKGKKVSLGSAAHTAHPILKMAFEIEGLKQGDYTALYMSGGSGAGARRMRRPIPGCLLYQQSRRPAFNDEYCHHQQDQDVRVLLSSEIEGIL